MRISAKCGLLLACVLAAVLAATAQAQSSGSIDFQMTQVGQNRTATATFTNTGVTSVSVVGIGFESGSAVSPPFAVTDVPTLPWTLAGGERIVFTVRFAPTAPGTFTDAVVITVRAGFPFVQTIQRTIALTGQGVGAAMDWPGGDQPDGTEAQDLTGVGNRLDAIEGELDELREAIENLGWLFGQMAEDLTAKLDELATQLDTVMVTVEEERDAAEETTSDASTREVSLTAKVVSIEGDEVEVLLPGETEWIEPEPGMELAEGTKISTGRDTSITVRFDEPLIEDQAVMRFGSMSNAKIDKFLFRPESEGRSGAVTTRVRMKYGSMRARITETTAGPLGMPSLKVATPALGAGVTGTTFSMSYDAASGGSVAEIFEGSMEVHRYAEVPLDLWELTPPDCLVVVETVTISGDGLGNGQRATVTADGVLLIEDLTDMDPAEWLFPEDEPEL